MSSTYDIHDALELPTTFTRETRDAARELARTVGSVDEFFPVAPLAYQRGELARTEEAMAETEELLRRLSVLREAQTTFITRKIAESVSWPTS